MIFLKLLTLFLILAGILTIYLRIAKILLGMGAALMVVLILICL